MPQASNRLCEKFMIGNDDGIQRCEEIIRAGGGTVERGIIRYTGNDPEVFDAIEYLVYEWDYG